VSANSPADLLSDSVLLFKLILSQFIVYHLSGDYYLKLLIEQDHYIKLSIIKLQLSQQFRGRSGQITLAREMSNKTEEYQFS